MNKGEAKLRVVEYCLNLVKRLELINLQIWNKQFAKYVNLV